MVFANGDPTDRISALIGSGNPTPRKISDIQVVSEKLYIHLSYYSEYTVRYVLWNNSDKDYSDIDYAFPVDYAGGGEKYLNSELIQDDYSESSFTVGWHDDYVKSISFLINGEELPYERSEEAVLKKNDPVKKSDFFPDKEYLQQMSEKERKDALEEAKAEYEYALKWSEITTTYRRWFYTKFSIKAHQAVTLDVHYALRNFHTRSTYFSIGGGGRCELSYDFSPAQYWGDGKVWDFSVQVDASELAVVPDFWKNEYSISTEGLPLTRNENLFSYTTQNFPFKNATPLTVNYILINNIPLPDLLNLRIPNEQYTISVTSEQKNYLASNLNDMNPATAWVTSDKGGVGEKIIIRFNKPTDVSELMLINGYHKNEKTYLENNRIRKMNVTVKGKVYWKNEVADDERYVDLSYESNNNYRPVSFERLKQHPDVSSVQIAYPFETFKATWIELAIEEVYKGTKYDDTCISEIILFGKEQK
jgi:hypothetical protein